MDKIQKLDEFYLKIIALFTMTLDHIGIFLRLFTSAVNQSQVFLNLITVFRILGRISFPLIVFMIVEGVIHTRKFSKYLIRLSTLCLITMISQILIYYLLDSSIEYASSPLIDLLLIALIIYLIKRKDKFSFFSILPIGYILLCFIINIYLKNNPNITVIWLPFYLRADYNIIGLLLALGFYFSHFLASKMVKKYNPTLQENEVNDDSNYQTYINIISMSTILIVALLVYLSGFIAFNGVAILDVFNSSLQSWMILSIIPLLFYNGKRGYNANWFKYGCYLYFPIHIVVIFLIFYVIF